MAPKPKRPEKAVSVSTFHKWQTQQEKEHNTLSWLRCDKHENQVTTICRKFEHSDMARNFGHALDHSHMR